MKTKVCKENKKLYEKEIKGQIKGLLRNYGYKGIGGYIIFKNIDEYFISAAYDVQCKDSGCFFVANLGIKNMCYDEILWSILDMEENMKAPLSIRATGAFIAPSVPIGNFKYEITDVSDIYNILTVFLNDIEEKVVDFLENESLGEYILKEDIKMWQYENLKVLALIDEKKYKDAIFFIESELAKGKKGTFMQGEDCFNDLSLKFCLKELNQ